MGHLQPIRLLILTSYLRCPPLSGGAQRMIGPIVRLAQLGHYQVTFLFQCRDDGEVRRAEVYFASYPWISVIGVTTETDFDIAGDRLSSEIPVEVLDLMDLGYCKEVERLLSTRHFDIIQVEHSQMSWIVPIVRPLAPDTSVILEMQNVEYRIWERWSRYAGRGDEQQISNLFQRMRKWEHEVWHWYDACLTIAPEETEIARSRLADQMPVYEVPVGIDVERFSRQPQAAENRARSIVFVGTLEWFPNTHGLKWFVEGVLPAIRSRLPEAKFAIAGYGQLQDELAACVNGRQDVELLGTIDPDQEQDLLSQCGVFVVPLWIGAGARVKIATAWAAGAPVVTTSIGAEGLDCRDEENVLVADDPARFADQVVRVLEDPGLAEHLAENGRRMVAERYSLDGNARLLHEIYVSLKRRGMPHAEAERRSSHSVGALGVPGDVAAGSAGPAEERQVLTVTPAALARIEERRRAIRALLELKSDLKYVAARRRAHLLYEIAAKERVIQDLSLQADHLRTVLNSAPYRLWKRTRMMLPAPLRRALGSPV